MDITKLKEACIKAIQPIGNIEANGILNSMKRITEFQSHIYPRSALDLIYEIERLRADCETSRLQQKTDRETIAILNSGNEKLREQVLQLQAEVKVLRGALKNQIQRTINLALEDYSSEEDEWNWPMEGWAQNYPVLIGEGYKALSTQPSTTLAEHDECEFCIKDRKCPDHGDALIDYAGE